MHETIFTDIQVAAAGAALPLIRLARRQVLLKEIVIRKRPESRLPLRLDLVVNCPVLILQRPQLPLVIVNGAHRRIESQLQRAPRNGQGIFGMLHPRSHHGIDTDIERGI